MNPFLIQVEEKEEYTEEEYMRIQTELRSRTVEPLVRSMYTPKNSWYKLEHMVSRCSRGLHQEIIVDGRLPIQECFRIGNGGDGTHCIVSCTAFSNENGDDSRYQASLRIRASLEEAGYNGYFLWMAGGYPNPTGTEMKYVGVPYSFKVFMMLEARKRGFQKVVWIDSACLCLRDPQPLFDALDTQPTVCMVVGSNNNWDAMVMEETIRVLNEMTGHDLHNAPYVVTVVMGWRMGEAITPLVCDYYDMVERGTPFLSIFPEEVVLSALFQKHKNLLRYYPSLYCFQKKKDWETAKREGFYFYRTEYASTS